jgi:hypothetical protein
MRPQIRKVSSKSASGVAHSYITTLTAGWTYVRKATLALHLICRTFTFAPTKTMRSTLAGETLRRRKYDMATLLPLLNPPESD